jgi:hypothetical protein
MARRSSPRIGSGSALKKKVPWKGKNILVLLPWDDERGQTGKAPTPLADKDVEAMLEKWEASGYDTTGFNLGHSESGEGGHGQSRGVWPPVEDVARERQQRSFRVSIPDRRGKLQRISTYVYPLTRCPIPYTLA